jgi:hypothetical protein
MIRLGRSLPQLGFDAGAGSLFSWLRVALVAGMLAATMVGLLIAIQLVPEWQVHRAGVHAGAPQLQVQPTPQDVANLQDQMRKTFLQVVGGVFAVIALYYTYRRVRVAEQGHITDRYTKAIEQLGALTAMGEPNIEVRLGAIYALERIAFDSPRDHWTVMEVLTAYVRQNSPAPVTSPAEEENRAAVTKGPRTEIQAVLTILGRRRRGTNREKKPLDLSATDLRGANLRGSHLERALLWGANLEAADFRMAHVERAYFTRANLKGALFTWAHLEGAFLPMAYLAGANFLGAHLNRTSFSRAFVETADFGFVDGLRAEQIKMAIGWQNANFDPAFARELSLSGQINDGHEGVATSALDSRDRLPEP